MVIGFQPRFVEPILNGTKVHTMRLDPRNRWKPGMVMHMATGVRTKNYREFHRQRCFHVQMVRIMFWLDADSTTRASIAVDGRELQPSEVQSFAKADGFIDAPDMYRWLKPHDGLILDYRLIHWTSRAY